MNRNGLAVLVCTVLTLPLACAAEDTPPALEQVLERYIEAAGGRQALEGLESRIVTGRQIDDRPYRGPVETVPFEAWSTGPDRWEMILHRPDGDLVEESDRSSRPKLAWLLNPRGPLMLEDHFPGLVMRDMKTVDGRLKFVIESDLDPAHYSLTFDAETGLLTGIGYYWELSEYRNVDGVLVPFRITMGRKGGSTTWEFETVEHNVALPPPPSR